MENSLSTYSKEARSKQLPLGQDPEDLSLGLACCYVLDLCPGALDHVDPLRRLDVLGRQGWLGKQELGFLENKINMNITDC